MFRNRLHQYSLTPHIDGSERLVLICSISRHEQDRVAQPPALRRLCVCVGVCIPGGGCDLPPFKTVRCVFLGFISPVTQKEIEGGMNSEEVI